MKKSLSSTQQIAGVALFTALTVVLQLLGSFIRFGPFSISLVTLAVIVGSALYGASVGAWLGFIFGATVLLSGDASVFLVFNPVGTIITVLVKGIACGWCAGVVYGLLEDINKFVPEDENSKKLSDRFHLFYEKREKFLAAFISSIVCSVVNTGLFLVGCLIFFMPLISEWAAAAGFGENAGRYMILGLVGNNFIIELALDIVLSQLVLRLIQLGRSLATPSAKNKEKKA